MKFMRVLSSNVHYMVTAINRHMQFRQNQTQFIEGMCCIVMLIKATCTTENILFLVHVTSS